MLSLPAVIYETKKMMRPRGAEQTNQITKAHKIINSSTSLCFLELVCVREGGETLQIYINILEISKAE